MKDDGDRQTARGRGALPQRAPATPAAKHQPSKAEQEEEVDMPGASCETVRRAFFRPFKPQRDEPE